MPARLAKGVIPADSEFTAEEDAAFERVAVQDLASLMGARGPLALWRYLPKAHPATRRRLLCLCLRRCSEAKAPVPDGIISLLEKELAVKGPPRNRVRTTTGMLLAASYLVRHPKCSLEKLAVKSGAPGKKTTVSSYFGRDEFWKLCSERILLRDIDRQYIVLKAYQKKFGFLDYNGVALCYVVPGMLRALKAGAALDRSSVENAYTEYEKALSPESLRERLTVHH
jgi:hypothetical protein